MKMRGEIILGDKRGYRRASVRRRRRFLVVALVMLGVSYIFWASVQIKQGTRVKQALLDISRIEHAARLFRADHGRCPDDMVELISPPGESRYLEDFVDPWGRPYKLFCPARLDPGGVQVVSGGPDENLNGDDNISSL